VTVTVSPTHARSGVPKTVTRMDPTRFVLSVDDCYVGQSRWWPNHGDGAGWFRYAVPGLNRIV
jgi:hypothetical protein